MARCEWLLSAGWFCVLRLSVHRSTIRIALENTSSSPVDFVKLTFSDMHTTSTQAYVAENELPPGEAYEIEAENLHRPVFSWSSSSAPLILPGASTVLEVQCLGKVGWFALSPPFRPI
jgi:hypothetical protein